MGLLYGRAGRLTAKNGGFRPGQINIIRDPRWVRSLLPALVHCDSSVRARVRLTAVHSLRFAQGRNQETISEDPLVAGEYGKQWSLGMQYDRATGDDRPPPAEPSAGEMMAVATIKHVLGCEECTCARCPPPRCSLTPGIVCWQIRSSSGALMETGPRTSTIASTSTRSSAHRM